MGAVGRRCPHSAGNACGAAWLCTHSLEAVPTPFADGNMSLDLVLGIVIWWKARGIYSLPQPSML